MRTTIDLPDSLFRALKIRAAEENLSLKELAVAAFNHYLGVNDEESQTKPWMKAVESARGLEPEIDRVQETIDAEFGTVDADEWK